MARRGLQWKEGCAHKDTLLLVVALSLRRAGSPQEPSEVGTDIIGLPGAFHLCGSGPQRLPQGRQMRQQSQRTEQKGRQR